jgi:hypothetical protein
MGRLRFGCYSSVGTGSAGQAPGGKEAKEAERTHIDALFPLGGRNALSMAVSQGHEAVVRVLLKH